MKNKFRLLIGLFLIVIICISNGAVFADDGSTPGGSSGSCDGFDCEQPEPQSDWEDGDTITAQMYFDNYPANQDGATMEDKADSTNTQYEVECGDPDTIIYVGTSSGSPVEHELTVTSPDSSVIQDQFGADAIDDLQIGVNVSQEENWDDTMEKYVYWSLLGYSVSMTPEQQANANLVQSGAKDTILQQIDILFLLPPTDEDGNFTKQLTFIQVCAEKVGGCTDPTADNYNKAANYDDGTCYYAVYGCTDSAAENYNSKANTDDGTCRLPKITVPEATNTDLLFSVTGVDKHAINQQWLIQGLILCVGISFTFIGVRKNK